MGIYVNQEYPPDIKKVRDRLRPILKLAKSLPDLKDKSHMENDKLVINGIKYGLEHLNKLPVELTPYKLQKNPTTSTLRSKVSYRPAVTFIKVHSN